MFTPAIFTRNNSFWRDPFEEFDAMFPAFFDNGDLEKSFSGFKTDVMEKDGEYVLQAELQHQVYPQGETQCFLQQKLPRSQCDS